MLHGEWCDCKRCNYRLCPPLWGVLDTRLGPAVASQWDLMASGANAQTLTDKGDALPHYTRRPTRDSSGAIFFSQTLTARLGLYANPSMEKSLSGESLHSVMQLAYWKSPRMAGYYMKEWQVLCASVAGAEPPQGTGPLDYHNLVHAGRA